MRIRVLSAIAVAALFLGLDFLPAQTINLPTSKQLIGMIPGHPERLNSLPISMAVSPDGRYVVTVNAGYGTYESRYDQSLAVLDTRTGKLTDFPDARTGLRARQTLFSGLAFSRDGTHIFASMASLTDPTGLRKGDTGNAIAVYSFTHGTIAPERLIPLPLVPLPSGRTTLLIGQKAGNKGIPYPSAIAVVGSGGHEQLLVAENLSDDVVLLDPVTGAIEHRFDLSESDTVPSTYPAALAVSKDGKRAFVALWNASQIVELDLVRDTLGRTLDLLKPTNPIAPGTHPSAFALSPDGTTLYVALSNRDAIAAVNVAGDNFSLNGYFDTRLPGQSYFGAEPVALALNANGSRLYAANLGTNSVAVINTRQLTARAAREGMVEPIGFIPTEWMPLSLVFISSSASGKLYVATDKGKGTGPNDFPQRQVPGEPLSHQRGFTYIATLVYGSLATLDASQIPQNLAAWTANVIQSNRIKAAQQKIAFAGGARDRIKHVIYIIKENRAYDQIFGDLSWKGKQVGNGDPGLAMYGAKITPNEHKLALQFGVLDNFYDSGEVSGDGHNWSTAAISSDFLEKTWQQNYRGDEHTYDYQGVVADGLPLLQKIPDVDAPSSGYIWGDLATHRKTYYDFGEFISSTFCNTKAVLNPQNGPMRQGGPCQHPAIEPGHAIPAEWGGGVNKWAWPIPVMAANVATKPQLEGHFAASYPEFNLSIPDQIRMDIFLRHFKGWVADLKQGKDTMPQFILIWLPDDHTNGTRPGYSTPAASVADNDLAVGRAVDAVSHSPFWNNTAFFILEDDAQNGPDHVDAHRSIALIISKYSPRGPHGGPFVDSHFYSTVSVVRTIEMLLGLPPMNNNDAFCSVLSSLFTGPGNQPPYNADYANEQNDLIYKANSKNAYGASASMKMDFTHEDRAPTQELNIILWKDAMGNKPVPAMLLAPVKKSHHGDDD